MSNQDEPQWIANTADAQRKFLEANSGEVVRSAMITLNPTQREQLRQVVEEVRFNPDFPPDVRAEWEKYLTAGTVRVQVVKYTDPATGKRMQRLEMMPPPSPIEN